MRIASNKLSELYTFYKNELSSIYDEGELYAIFELVCETYLGFSKTDVRLKLEEKINQSNLINIYNTGVELRKGIPVQYVLGEADFYNLKFKVNASTLIPRPETEELVDLIVKQFSSHSSLLSILDIGTGSGCIPIALKKNLPGANVVAIDISDQALEVAKENAVKNNAEATFQKTDVLALPFLMSLPIATWIPFSIIVSNPPYVLSSEAKQMDARVLTHEPHLALFVEDSDPIIFYKRIIDLCETHLQSKGYLFFELNPLYAEAIKNYANAANLFIFTELINDMSGKQRFLKAQRK
jgi:release factor glutamine methyltransferase